MGYDLGSRLEDSADAQIRSSDEQLELLQTVNTGDYFTLFVLIRFKVAEEER